MLVQWTPFRELSRLQGEMDRFFDGRTAPSARAPLCDVTEDADKVVIEADLPGVEQKDIELAVEKDLLTLKATRKLKRDEQPAEAYRRYERTGGEFLRTFKLSPKVDAEKIEASFKDGVLTLKLPKKPEAQPRQIKISVQ